ncbi:transporter substrate-binding domain-containing protein [Pseudomonas sp. HAR-UPW-AIA-41]|uniref:transporter substrate-binding domain-containing protein n=1 Tax=Pseudomonas sp. HAR-UPW-AIA-41 TaxID=1985301 RepID=UPI00159702B9|nr:transporter substrate-binding domain-containing protein [Pseudomonas sp. HAR-UPW-AIA-41]
MCRFNLKLSWLLLLSLVPLLAAGAALNAEQQAWLQQHPQIIWAPESDYRPFIYVEGQRPQGLSYDLLKLLQKRLDLPLQQAAAAPLEQLLSDARARKIDLLTSLRPTAERSEYLAFTSAYVQVPTVLLLRRDQRANLSLKDLQHQKVAVGEGYAVESFVRRQYPEVVWQGLPSDRDGVQALLSRQVDGVVLDLGSATYLLQQFNPKALQIGTRIGFDYPLSLAYRKDWPELGSILESGLHSISLQEREALFAPWLQPLATSPNAPGGQLIKIAALLMLLLTALLLAGYAWQRRDRQT